jgi:Na+/phosphate symporter
MDEFPYALGFVGHGDFSVNGNSKAFMVNSRKIKNTKYSSRRDQYYMQMTTDLKKAVKNASTYLTPYSVKELATLTYRQFAREIERVKDNVEAQRHKLTRPIRDNTNVIVTEIKNLMAQNVKFETEEFKALASSILEALAEQEEERKRKVFGIYVRIRNVGDNTYVDMHKVHDVKTNLHTMRDDGSPSTTVLLSELDAEIAGSVAVLNMLEDGHYVRQVGYKVDATTYWLERV